MNGYISFRLCVVVLLLAAMVLLSGCFSPSTPGAVRYQLLFRAHPQINHSAPLKVRVLQLKSDAEFMSADFWSLQNNAPALLAGNLLDSEQFFLRPGQLSHRLNGISSEGARFIGIMAEYQSLDGKSWRLSLPLAAASEGGWFSFWPASSTVLQAEIIADINGVRLLR